MNKVKTGIVGLLAIVLWPFLAQSQFKVQYHEQYGSIDLIGNESDEYQMNFVFEPRPDNHHDVAKNRWGLGGCTLYAAGKRIYFDWRFPVLEEINGNEAHVAYENQYLRIDVYRAENEEGQFVEQYQFSNKHDKAIRLDDVFIYTPFNDEYPNAETSITNRCNTHLWAGGDASYVNAMRMGGAAPHLGMVVTEGHVLGYDITAKVTSNERGIINLNFRAMDIPVGAQKQIEWKLFFHEGWTDFYSKALALGWVKATAKHYTLEHGEQAEIQFEGENLTKATFTIDGKPVTAKKSKKGWKVTTDTLSIGEHQVAIHWGEGKSTWADVIVKSPFLALAKTRMDFILDHQTDVDKESETYRAFMVYDNEDDQIVYSQQSKKYTNIDEGAERNGMGIAMAQLARLTGEERYTQAARDYADYVHEKLQAEDYTTYSDTRHTTYVRGYNFIFVSNVFLETYQTTKDEKYLDWAYNTLVAFHKRFPGFYAIDVPCESILAVLKESGRTEQYNRMLGYNRTLADTYLKNGLHVPEHEVNYEQTIIAPAVAYLCEFYLVTKEEKYLEGAKLMLPALNSFNGFQPNFHLNDIAIRHWDGYWFGKTETWGDVFPHYWSAFTGNAFWRYAEATGDQTYATRAQDVVRNNLCQFFEDGRASCAYIFPDAVNGEEAEFYDPYANDQDYAMVYFLRIYEQLARNKK